VVQNRKKEWGKWNYDAFTVEGLTFLEKAVKKARTDIMSFKPIQSTVVFAARLARLGVVQEVQ